ncbi:AidA/PixA family protein [uncultured Tenacibaculum sp.]|uniref:AidA/PixA family protein n=1 Tax=uncultured Tenacibaculum sp. TaxID=174713 RepID=UPI0026296A14|nr:AidA/PixA family protein [uncultured Tenacibaculum sp.]
MATIDILCVIDTNGLMKKGLKPGTLDNPTGLGGWSDSDSFVFMICDGQYACNNQGKSELSIKANIGDTLRWTITDPSTGLISGQQNKSFSCILYKFKSAGINKQITDPVLKSTPALTYYNSLNSATTPSAGAYMCSSWTSSVLSLGSNIQYDWSFQVIDNFSGDVVGYYTWDPFINVQEAAIGAEVEAL